MTDTMFNSPALMAGTSSYPYVKVTAEPKGAAKARLAEELEEAVEELKLVRAGKKKTRTLTEFLDEL